MPRTLRLRRRAASAPPRLWLLSDARRLPDPLPMLARLPRGAALLLRDLPESVMRAAARAARARGLVAMVAGDGRLALALRAGLHVPDRRGVRHLLPFLAGGGLLSVAVHGRAGVARARRLRADAALVSPAFATASHPGAPGLGPLRWAALARALPCPAVALGGMDARRARRLGRRAWGWAAIGAWGGAVVPAPQCVTETAQGVGRPLPGIGGPTHSHGGPR